MRSLIIIEVEHGDTTDPLDEYLDHIGLDQNYGLPEGDGFKTLNYAVRVDLPACFELENGVIPSDQPLDYSLNMTDEAIAQELIDMDAFGAWLEGTSTLPEFYNLVMREIDGLAPERCGEILNGVQCTQDEDDTHAHDWDR